MHHLLCFVTVHSALPRCCRWPWTWRWPPYSRHAAQIRALHMERLHEELWAVTLRLHLPQPETVPMQVSAEQGCLPRAGPDPQSIAVKRQYCNITQPAVRAEPKSPNASALGGSGRTQKIPVHQSFPRLGSSKPFHGLCSLPCPPDLFPVKIWTLLVFHVSTV